MQARPRRRSGAGARGGKAEQGRKGHAELGRDGHAEQSRDRHAEPPRRPARVPARKSLGQHFLHDPAVLRKIVDTIDPHADDAIVEIGGGLGALTAPLLERVRELHVVEVDPRLAEGLEGLGSAGHRLVLHRADALLFDFAALAPRPRSLRIAGNLPYNISTPLLFHLLRQRAAIADMHLMLQKEVVARMTAAPGGREYGRLTVMLALWTDVERCFDIGPGAFAPPPKVWSSFVRLVPRVTPRFAVEDEERFARLVAHLFSMRRKTIGRALKGRVSGERIAAAGVDPKARPETLAPEDFGRLSQEFQ